MNCPLHPGVSWALTKPMEQAEVEPPCFVCDPAWWVEHDDLDPMQFDANADPKDPGGAAAAVREMVESGHWPLRSQPGGSEEAA